MKQLIISLLRNGFTTTKKSIEDLTAYCYLVDRIAEYDECTKTIRCNANKFWNCENNKNRIQLIHDILKSCKGIKGMFDIYNRYENGDGYGIFNPNNKNTFILK